MILSRKPVYSALFLLVNFGTLAALYIMLQAQFLAAVQVIVYAGAIVVLFLFVVMLIGGGELDRHARLEHGHLGMPGRPWPRIAGDRAGRAACWPASAMASSPGSSTRSRAARRPSARGSVQAIGTVLYTDYLLPFELTSVLLLVGMIGAVVLARAARLSAHRLRLSIDGPDQLTIWSSAPSSSPSARSAC